jgi:hypothetical protein
VAARIEDGVEVLLPDAVEAKGLVELGFRGGVLLEPNGKVGAEFRFVALGVKQRSAALRGGECDLNTGVLENVIGSSEFFEPEARLSSGVTQLVCDVITISIFIDCLPCLLPLNDAPPGITIAMFRRALCRFATCYRVNLEKSRKRATLFLAD